MRHKSQVAEGKAIGGLSVVGIAGSSLDLGSVVRMMAPIPKHDRLCFILHLDALPGPEQDLDVLSKSITGWTVLLLGTEPVGLQPGYFYILPRNHGFEQKDSLVAAKALMPGRYPKAPVDLFFRLLSDWKAEQFIAVVLSGIGVHGSSGIRRVKEDGGVVFVQSPDDALFPEMPVNALRAGFVDAALPASALGREIRSYVDQAQSLADARILGGRLSEAERSAIFAQILEEVTKNTGFDFSAYKESVLFRRADRRMQLLGISNAHAYLTHLRGSIEELAFLLRDFLISVTYFFRDRRVFAFLESLVATAPAFRVSSKKLRVWVAGCATGEEAYSLAILLQEHADANEGFDFEIIATDINELALEKATAARYSLTEMAEVSAARSHRFFEASDGGFQVRDIIRQKVVFQRHHLLEDPPFEAIDMVSCRNLMVYLNKSGRKAVFDAFWSCLSAGGYLLLGFGEALDFSEERRFVTVSAACSLYQKIEKNG